MSNVYRFQTNDRQTDSLKAEKLEAIDGHFICAAHRKTIAKYCFFILLSYKIYKGF